MSDQQPEMGDKQPPALAVGVGDTVSVSDTILIDFRFLETYYELWCIGEYSEILRRQLPELLKRERSDAYSRFKRTQLDPSDFHIEHQQLDEMLSKALPRLLFNPLLVALWGVLESTVKDVARYLKDARDCGLDIDDLRERELLARAKKYFEHVLGFCLADTASEDWRRAKMLEVLRNGLAHANGRLEAMSCGARRKIEGWEKENIGVSTDSRYVYCSDQFVARTYKAVDKILKDLLQRAKADSRTGDS